MRNYMPLMNEAQKEELKERIALELFIENFSSEDLNLVFLDASQERLTDLAISLSEDRNNDMTNKALHKYGAVAEEIVNTDQERGQSYFIQAAQVLVDFGNQNKLV